MKKIYFLSICLLITTLAFSQTGTEFWFAPPNITDDHRPVDSIEVYLNFTCLDTAADITISQPANAGFTPITFSMPANSSYRQFMGPYVYLMETKPTNTVLNTGLLIQSTKKVSVYYEYDNTNNPDIFALKGKNALGNEFYIPLNNYAPFRNNIFADTAYASFDIVATEDNTTVRIYPPRDVNGHPGLQQFSILLNRGQTYSCAWTGANYDQPSTHPYGSAVVSDKPIAISIKDDSDHNPSGGCYDLMGDQIVPTNIIGQEYIVVQGQLNGGESIFILATQNNTDVYINGSPTPVANLFAGETFRYDITGPGNERTYVFATENVYVTHVTGFGCEEGIAVLPPLNCAGSKEVSFSRSTNEGFFLTLLVKNGSQGDFVMSPASATIDTNLFDTVPGTGGVWVAAIQQFNTTEIPVNTAFRLTNTSNIFAMGIINGGTVSGCRYGYFSEFVSEIFVNAGTDQTICANSFAQLNGSVSGGVTTGQWSSNGSGTFSNPDDLNATYTPSYTDQMNGSVILTLTSTGMCFPTTDQMTLIFDPTPTVNAGIDQTVCANNANVTLNGSVTIASGGIWSGGSGTYTPNNTTLNAAYAPTVGEISSGSLTLYLTTTGNGTCVSETDSMVITFTPAPTVNAGIDQTVCTNNPNVTLNGTGTVATAWQWINGTGSYNPGSTALNTIYTPSGVEIANGSVTLTLTSTVQGNCNAVNDNITINFSAAPIVDAGADQIKCANNASTTLNGSVSASATTGTWSGGSGSFSPNNNTLNAVYTPSASEISNGSVTLTLTSTGNGTCIAENDQMTISFTPAPTVNAGIDQTVCITASSTQMYGSVSGGTSTGLWTTMGSGTFTPNDSDLNASYIFSSADSAAGSVNIVLTSTNNDNCVAESDTMTINFGNTTFAYAGVDQTTCASNLNIQLNGLVSGGTSTGVWSTLGSGVFSDPNDLNAIYTCGVTDSIIGSVDLILTTTNNGGCTAGQDTMNITIVPIPVVNAGTDFDVCLGMDTIALGGTAQNTNAIMWETLGSGNFYPNDSDINAYYLPSSSDSINGQAIIILHSAGNLGCNESLDSLVIHFVVPLIPDFTNSNACNHQIVMFYDNSTITTGTVTDYEWNFDGNIVFAQDTSYSFDTTGTFDVMLTVTSSLGCSYSVTKPVIVHELPQPNFSNTSSCYLDAFDFTDLSSIGTGTIASWRWIFGNGDISYFQNTSETFANSGTYNVMLTATSNSGCSSSISQQVEVFPLPSANFTSSYNCQNSTVTFTDNSSATGQVLNSWYWDFGDGNNSTNQNPIHQYSSLGNQNVTLIVGSSSNCTDTISQNLNLQFVTADFAFSNGCSYDSIQFTNTSSVNGDTTTTYFWTFDDGQLSSLENPVHLFQFNGTYDVLLQISTQLGCEDSITHSIIVYPSPIAGFNYTADDYIVGNIIIFSDFSSGANNWQWDFGDIFTSSIQNPQHIYNTSGNFTVIQVVSNEYNCVDTASTILIINPGEEIHPPKLPNAFSPNGDGQNDIFYPRGGPFTSIDFSIYNNWGEKIFNTTDITGGWDGTKKNVDQPIGTYVWTLEAVTIDGKEYKKSGDVTLIR